MPEWIRHLASERQSLVTTGSRVLLVFALVYVYSVMATVPTGQHTTTLSSWFFLPGLLLPGLLLLAGSGLFAVLERRRAVAS